MPATPAVALQIAFHGPAGNVRCEPTRTGVICTIESRRVTVLLADGQRAHRAPYRVIQVGRRLAAGDATGVPEGQCAAERAIICTQDGGVHGFAVNAHKTELW